MSWEAIGEVVGALGVIASPVYLAIQMRQNTRQIRQNIEVGQVASHNQAQAQTWQALLAMVQDSEALRGAAKFNERGPDALTAEEAACLQAASKQSATYIEGRVAEQGVRCLTSGCS